MCPGPFDVIIERRTVQLFPRIEGISDNKLEVAAGPFGSWALKNN